MLQGAPPPRTYVLNSADQSGAVQMFVLMVDGDVDEVVRAVTATGANITAGPFPADWRVDLLVRATEAGVLASGQESASASTPPHPAEGELPASG